MVEKFKKKIFKKLGIFIMECIRTAGYETKEVKEVKETEESVNNISADTINEWLYGRDLKNGE